MSRPVLLTGTSFVLAAAMVAVAACSAREPSAYEAAVDDEIVHEPGVATEREETKSKETPRSDAPAEQAAPAGTTATEATTASRTVKRMTRASATPPPSPAAGEASGSLRNQQSYDDWDAPEAELDGLADEEMAPASPMQALGGAIGNRGSSASAPGKKAEEKSAPTMRDRRAASPAVDAIATGSGASAGYDMNGGLLPAGPAAAPLVQVPNDPSPDPITMYGSSEDYVDYGVNPFTMVADDRLSTFSIDVDTASYSIARKKIEAGVLPPPEAVRVEEFVNYLDYGYRAPTDGSPFAVHMAAMPDPFRDGRHILRVGVQAKEVSRDERAPVHLTFLVDVSGSMSSADKLGLAKQSLHMLVDSLREDDTVALATYAGRTARILEPTSAGNKQQIHSAIENLKSGGSTAMSSGIDMAYEMAWESFEKGHENRVIVLSDGDANVGKTSWDDMLSQIKGYADRGVTVSTIGFGMGNYQDTLMEQLSNKGDGNNYYIDDAAQAQRVFVEELGGTLVTVARDVKIQVEFNPASVTAYRLIGYENRDVADKDFRNDKVDAGEIGSGHNVTALYEVIMAEGYDRSLATVRLRYEEPGADVDQGGSGGIEKAYTFRDRDLSERADFASRELRLAYSSATFAEILRHSPEVSELSFDDLIAFAQKAQRPGEEDDTELVGLMKKARALGAGTSGGAVSTR